MRFMSLAKRLREQLNLYFLDTPVFVRFCGIHQRFEWCDPFSLKGGVAPDLKSLKKQLINTYGCSECGYHINYVYYVNTAKLYYVYEFMHLESL